MYVSRIGPGKWTSVAGGRRFAKTARLRAVCGCLCGVFILNSAVANARADVSIELVAQWGGANKAIAVDGNRAYVGVGPRLAVLDFSDPLNPVELGRSDGLMRGLVEEIIVRGDYVYARAGSLHILDVSNPASPTLVGEYAAPPGDNPMRTFSVVGNYAYVGFWGADQLHVVDLSDPRSPKRVFAMELSRPANFIHSAGYLFARVVGEVVILDLSDPVKPRVVGHIDPLFDVKDIAISGSHAYLLSEERWVGIDIYDVSNPEAPVFVTNYAGFRTFSQWIDVRGGLAYLLGSDVLSIVDVSNPSNPTFVGEFSYSEFPRFSGSPTWFGQYMLMPDWGGGIGILDAGDPTAPVLAGRFALAENARSLALSDGFVYLGGQSPILHVIDVSVPVDPRQVAEVDLGQPVGSVTIDGSIAYVGAGDELHLIDVTDPTLPEIVASVGMSDKITDVTIAGQNAFVALRFDGVVILDVSDPQTPIQIGSYRDSRWLGSVSISGSAAFLFDFGGRVMRVVDVADPTAPFPMGEFTTGAGQWSAMKIRRARAYTANWFGGLVIMDISDPIAPRWLGRKDTIARARDVALSGNLAYVAVDVDGLEVVDVSNPRRPALIGRNDAFDRAFHVTVSGSYAFVADDTGGLVVFRVTNHGDADCNGRINARDIEPFLLALFEPEVYSGDYPNCDINNADINGDGTINASDIEPFIELLWGP